MHWFCVLFFSGTNPRHGWFHPLIWITKCPGHKDVHTPWPWLSWVPSYNCPRSYTISFSRRMISYGSLIWGCGQRVLIQKEQVYWMGPDPMTQDKTSVTSSKVIRKSRVVSQADPGLLASLLYSSMNPR